MAPDQLIALGVFILLLPVFGALIVLIVRERSRVEKEWTAFARECDGLKVERQDDGWPQLVGIYRSIPVCARAGRYGARSGSFTRLTASCRRQLPNHFALHPRGVLFALRRAAGVPEVQLGDAVFDRAFVIQGVDESQVRTLLADVTLRQRLLASFQGEPDLEVVRGQVAIQKNGVVTQPAKLRSMLDAATEVALALESAPASPAVQR